MATCTNYLFCHLVVPCLNLYTKTVNRLNYLQRLWVYRTLRARCYFLPLLALYPLFNALTWLVLMVLLAFALRN